MAKYVLDNAWQQARERLRGVELLYDPGTMRHLTALGVTEGWRCLEIGPGGGSITEWLCRCVGPSGHVVAVDIDPRFVEPLDLPNLEVRRLNVVTDPLPEREFDLVSTHAVLAHLPEREQVLTSMIAALKPSGWLLVEEPDGVSVVSDPSVAPEAAEAFARWWREGAGPLYAASGADIYLGRRLYGMLLRQGLEEVGSEGRVFMASGGTPLAQYMRLTAEQLRDRIVTAGLLTAAAAYLATLDNPDFTWMQTLVMAAWGRKPAA